MSFFGTFLSPVDKVINNTSARDVGGIIEGYMGYWRQVWNRAGQIPRTTFQSSDVSSPTISQSNPLIVASILKRHLIYRRTERHTRRYNNTEHTDIDACGSYGGFCAASFLPCEGTRGLVGCRCWRSMSEVVIVSIVKVLRHLPPLCWFKDGEITHIVYTRVYSFAGRTSLEEKQPDSHKEAKAGRSRDSTSVYCTLLLVSVFLGLAVRR